MYLYLQYTVSSGCGPVLPYFHAMPGWRYVNIVNSIRILITVHLSYTQEYNYMVIVLSFNRFYMILTGIIALSLSNCTLG